MKRHFRGMYVVRGIQFSQELSLKLFETADSPGIFHLQDFTLRSIVYRLACVFRCVILRIVR